MDRKNFKTFYQQYKYDEARRESPHLTDMELDWKPPESNHEEMRKVARMIKRDQLISKNSENNMVYYLIGGIVVFKGFRMLWNALSE